MLIFMRHGQRGDNEYPPIHSQIIYDPPITEQAKITMRKSAEQIFQIFQQKGIKKISIVSSPFLRCLMTAQLFCQQMKSKGIQQNKQRLINFSISQYMRSDWFNQYPLKTLLIDFKNRNVLSKYLSEPQKWKKIQFDHNIAFPQNYGHFSKRINSFKKSLVYPENQEAVIYFTHGFVVRQLCWRMNQVPDYRDQIKYCGYAIYENPSGNKDILLKSKL